MRHIVFEIDGKAAKRRLDERVNASLSRRLDEPYPFLIVDALFTKSRNDDRVVSKAG